MIRAVTALLYLAERKIEEAIARGDIDPLLPEELRLAYRILKNAGFSGNDADDTAERAKARKKLALLNARSLGFYCLTTLASCSEIALFRSVYSLQPKKHSLSSAERCSFALATLPTIR